MSNPFPGSISRNTSWTKNHMPSTLEQGEGSLVRTGCLLGLFLTGNATGDGCNWSSNSRKEGERIELCNCIMNYVIGIVSGDSVPWQNFFLFSSINHSTHSIEFETEEENLLTFIH